MEELTQRLVSWIREQALVAGQKGVLCGLSGGVDSSVVALLNQRAFPESSLALILPCRSRPEDLEHAQLLVSKFHLKSMVINLDRLFDHLTLTLPTKGFDGPGAGLARSNLKPRLRMLTLYYLANGLQHLVVGTGNGSEIAVGYFTKYGDGGVDILPLGNLVKRQVRALARHLGVPGEIIEKPPSAGLWPGQTDEGEMGLTYEELDSYLLGSEAPLEIRNKIELMAARSAHKRDRPPVPPF